ncbi:MAG: glycosyltransferase [Pseudomonadota bacterium]
MRILFVHDNYPAQFGQFGRWLKAAHGWDVAFATAREGVTEAVAGAPVYPYAVHREPTEGVHPYARVFEGAAIKGQAAARAFLAARGAGFSPEIVMAHAGWGPGIFAREVWPDARYVPYFEWYYRTPAPDMAHLGAPPPEVHQQLYQHSRNAPIWAEFAVADLGLVPTAFQAAQFPELFRDRLAVIHDGIDTEFHRPDPGARADVAGLSLPPDAEIVTYLTRGMEPHRGFPQFLEAIARLQPERPRLHAVIGGEDRIAYGDRRAGSWKEKMLAELPLDRDRLHFTGPLPRADYLRLLQASHVHFYFTTEFVLSWSMLEAMAAGALIVASDTTPVREFMVDGETGLLTDFHDVPAAAARIAEALDGQARLAPLRSAARAHVVKTLSAATLWERKRELLEDLLLA